MGFDKTELLSHKKELVRGCKILLSKIELVEDQLEDYIQYLSDEEKEHQLEMWEEKHEELLYLQDALEDWLENSKRIK